MPVFTVMGVLWATVSVCTAAVFITRRDVVVQGEPGVHRVGAGACLQGEALGPESGPLPVWFCFLRSVQL